jgi:hypothetical protein
VQSFCPRNRRQENSILRRFAGRSRAKSRPRRGKREAVNIPVFHRSADFKHAFDARPAPFASNSGRICLDRLCHNAYKKRISRKARQQSAKPCSISWLLFS